MVANTTGSGFLVPEWGRVTSAEDGRWVSNSNPNYGPGYHNWSENCGTGAEPNVEWENFGTFLPAGMILHKTWMSGRGNDTTNSPNFDYRMLFITPNVDTEWTQEGLNTDSDVGSQTLVADNWLNPTTAIGGVDQQFTNGVGRGHIRQFDLDFTVPVDGWISFFFRPERATALGTDYFRLSINHLMQYPIFESQN